MHNYKPKTSTLVLTLISIATLSVSCASHTKRDPQSQPSLIEDMHEMNRNITSKIITGENCKAYFETQIALFHDERLHEIDRGRAEDESEKIAELAWQNRLAIHRRLESLVGCRTEIRKLFFQLRSIEDLAAERHQKVGQQTPKEIGEFQDQPTPLVDNAFFHGYYGPSGRVEKTPVQFQHGDLMVTRGPSFFAAALTMIPNNPSQLDHFVLVAKESDGSFHTVESYAQTGGVAAFEMTYALKNENARIQLLRAKDALVSGRAAEIMLNAVKAGKADPSKQIGYDYLMDLDNPKRMTCSAVSYWGFRRASNDTFVIPQEKSNVDPGLKQIFENTGIKMGPLLTAGDIELDTRFDLILEFRDPRLVQDLRIKEAVMNTIYTWMKEKNYRLRPTGSTIAIDTLIYPLHRTKLWPAVKFVTGSPDIPPGTPKGFVKTLTQLNDLGDILYKRLHDAYKKSKETTGWGLSHLQMADVLESYRQEDMKRCISHSGAYAHFHRAFGAIPCAAPKRN